MSVLDVPKPSWFGEDIELLSETARRFFERECVPHYDEWEKRGRDGEEYGDSRHEREAKKAKKNGKKH